MKSRFESKWANRAAQAGITLAALGLFFAMRPDIYGSATMRIHADYQRKVVTPKIISQYMRETARPKLQIGAGASNAAGWLNTDIEPTASQAFLDITEPLPFGDNSVYAIFGEHVIEHVTYEQALYFLKESHRVLAPGGKVRMVTPNLLKFAELLREPNPEYFARKLDFHFWPADTPDPAAFILNNEMRSFGHQFVYTPAMIRASFEKAGFTQIKQWAPGETDDPDLKDMEIRPRGDWKDVNAFEAMAFEATR